MSLPFAPIAEYHQVTPELFQDVIQANYQPAILRGLVQHWPCVQAAQTDQSRLLQDMAQCDNGTKVDAIMLRPETHGRVFYDATMDGFNFIKNKVTITSVLEQLIRYAQFDRPPSVAIQSALVGECLPKWRAALALNLLAPEVEPRIWIGNQITTPTHIDGSDNIACVVSGRREFVLFPPEQIANLYIGPLDFAPTPSPISMVDLRAPDLTRYPRFENALAHAQSAVLEPGDAIYIPNLWWHHVESLEKINVLVNYWWGGSNFSTENKTSPYGLLMQALLSFKELPPSQRAAWGHLFQHYVFDETSPAAHIPAHRHGVLQR
ncbi:cupin-like domain-containing protein [Undibacterium fentianense]|uniref:Cupin-like domain-containing protein n=1 Tax=Undibacterium fentianense TaxID=2828728 RepID=A0A941E615_9BURK|nr:cupin-like domain-containing protein [Undibacterium fentianense]MBR7800398.1 cupin-like domain-containing protein [Undibacterium fentianense]